MVELLLENNADVQATELKVTLVQSLVFAELIFAVNLARCDSSSYSAFEWLGAGAHSYRFHGITIGRREFPYWVRLFSRRYHPVIAR